MVCPFGWFLFLLDVLDKPKPKHTFFSINTHTANIVRVRKYLHTQTGRQIYTRGEISDFSHPQCCRNTDRRDRQRYRFRYKGDSNISESAKISFKINIKPNHRYHLQNGKWSKNVGVLTQNISEMQTHKGPTWNLHIIPPKNCYMQVSIFCSKHPYLSSPFFP